MSAGDSGFRPCAAGAVLAVALWAAPAFAIEPTSPLTDPMLKPWAATVWVDGKHECGASLIDPHWVLTARHCVSSFCGKKNGELTLVQVRVPDRPDFPAMSVVCPKVQGGGLLPSDVALVFIQYVRDVEDKLPAFGRTSMTQSTSGSAPSFSLISVGWAKGDETRDSAHSLELVPPSREKCLKWLNDAKTCPQRHPLGSNQFCAWAAETPTGFHGLQKGDSGGPVVRKASPPEVVGVASAACSTGLAIFEDVSQYRRWIVDKVCGYYKPWPDQQKSCRKRLE